MATVPTRIGTLEVPDELHVSVLEFWPQTEWINAFMIAKLESDLDAFALNDSASEAGGCGRWLRSQNGVAVYSERSVGYFQINSCNFPEWEWQRLYNARHNAGTAHMLWDNAGGRWEPWYFSAQKLGLL